jgi:uncharacterized membrane protein
MSLQIDSHIDKTNLLGMHFFCPTNWSKLTGLQGMHVIFSVLYLLVSLFIFWTISYIEYRTTKEHYSQVQL